MLQKTQSTVRNSLSILLVYPLSSHKDVIALQAKAKLKAAQKESRHKRRAEAKVAAAEGLRSVQEGLATALRAAGAAVRGSVPEALTQELPGQTCCIART